LEARSVVSSKEAGLEFEEKDFQLLVLLALVSVFERTRMVLEVSADSVVPVLGQGCSMARGVMKAHTFLLSRMLLAEEEGGVCTSWM